MPTTFEEQVEALTEITVGSDVTAADLGQYLTDGANDVITRIQRINPSLARTFTSSTSDSGAGVYIDGEIIDVYGTEASYDRPASEIPARLKGNITDTSSLYYRSAYSPVFYREGKKVFVKPSGGTIVHLNKPSVATTDSSIVDFPEQYWRLVALYGAFMCLNQLMANRSSITLFDLQAVAPTAPVAPTIADKPTIPTVPTAPSFVYTPPTIDAAYASQSAPGGFSVPSIDSSFHVPLMDAGFVSLSNYELYRTLTFDITATPPPVPSSPSFSYTDASLQNSVDSVSLVFGATPPTYTQPDIDATHTEVTDTSPGTLGAEEHAFEEWLGKAGQYIEDDQDVELASSMQAQLSTFIGAYQSAMQNQMNIFQAAQIEYQAELERASAEFNQDVAAKLQKMSMSTELDTVNRGKELDRQIQEYTQELTRYQGELSKYQAEVQTQVQEYNTERSLVMQAWQGEIGNLLQKFQAEVGAQGLRLQEYQANIQSQSLHLQQYQGDVQAQGVLLGKYQADLQIQQADFQKQTVEWQSDLGKYQAELQAYSTEYGLDMQDYTTKYQADLGKYQADVQAYTAKVGVEVQDYQMYLQKEQIEYQWPAQRYQALKAQYDQAFAMMLPPQQKGE